MKLISIRSGFNVTLSVVMLIGSPLLAADPTEVRTSDYRLGTNGMLTGSVLNQSGQPVSGLPVEVFHKDQRIAVAVSDENGNFAVDGLRNGPHTVKLGASRQAVRFWSTSTAAPPTAQSAMAIVVDEAIVRGQALSRRGLAGGVVLIGGAVATAIVLSNNDDKPGNNDNSNAVLASP